MPSNTPPPIPSGVKPPRDDNDNQRLTWPWKLLLAIACIGICALVVRLIYARDIVKESDAIKTDVTTVAKTEKRLNELKRRHRLAHNAQERSEAQYLILAEIKTLPTRLSDYTRNEYEKMRQISAPLNDATLAYNKDVAALFGTDGKWLAPFTTTPETLAEARVRLQTLAAENKSLRSLYQERIAALTREADTNTRNKSALELLRLSESKKSAYNLIRDSDAKIYETMDALLQYLIAEWGQWQHTRPPYLRWQTPAQAQQADELFEELSILYQQQRDAQLELLDLTWSG